MKTRQPTQDATRTAPRHERKTAHPPSRHTNASMKSAFISAVAVLLLAAATDHLARAADSVSTPTDLHSHERHLTADEPVVTEKVFFDITIGGKGRGWRGLGW